MERIFSKQEESKLLHVVHRASDFAAPRTDLTEAKEFIQVSAMSLPEKKHVLAHKHSLIQRQTSITQETIVVVEGSVKANYYDLDDTLLFSTVLQKGDCTVTLGGGHEFIILEENTKLYEIKNGPYLGKEYDYKPI